MLLEAYASIYYMYTFSWYILIVKYYNIIVCLCTLCIASMYYTVAVAGTLNKVNYMLGLGLFRCFYVQ